MNDATTTNPTTHPPPTSASQGATIGSDVKNAAKAIHGVGEAIRGTVNEAVDTAASDDAGMAKNRGVLEKGEQEMAAGEQVKDSRV